MMRGESDDVLGEWRTVLGAVSEQVPVIDWVEVHAGLGTELPVDYRVLSDNYLHLAIAGFMGVLHPDRSDTGYGLQEFVDETLGFLRDRRAIMPERMPYPLFPEPGGLLPWEVTDNNDFFFWLTSGEPDRWRVVVTDQTEWWEFEGGMQKFLVGLLRGDLVCPVFWDDFPQEGYEVEKR